MKRLICLLLILILICPSLFACDDMDVSEIVDLGKSMMENNGGGEVSTETDVKPESSMNDADDGAETPPPVVNDGENEGESSGEGSGESEDGKLPQYDFGGTEVIFAVGSENSALRDFGTLELDGSDVVNEASYIRNSEVEDTMNVSVEYLFFPDTRAQKSSTVGALSIGVMAGENTYDVAVMPYYITSELMLNGILANIAGMDEIDLQNGGWNKSLLNASTFFGNTFMLAGDVSVSNFENAYAVFYNKEYVNNYGMKSPSNLVATGEWTVEEMVKYAKNFIQGSNGNSGVLMSSYDILDSFMVGMDVSYFEKTAEGALTVSQTARVLSGSGFMTSMLEASTISANCDESFSNGSALFVVGTLSKIKTYSSLNFSFGLLPLPKFSYSQESYYTTSLNSDVIVFPYIGRANENTAASATVSRMQSLSEKTVVSALENEYFRYIPSARDNEAFDIVRKGIAYDTSVVCAIRDIQTAWRNGAIYNEAEQQYHMVESRVGTAVRWINENFNKS